jgi:hypothetical protein
MKVKVHWIIDGVAELDVASTEEAEAHVEAQLKQVIAASPILTETLGVQAIQGNSYLPGSEEDGDAK